MTKMKSPDNRGLLRAALSSRMAARHHREGVTVSLQKADAILADAQAQREHAQAGLEAAEFTQAEVIATAIKAGVTADAKLTPEITKAQKALADAESRLRMSTAARNQLADEVYRAENEVREADLAVMQAAERVILAEVEARCSLDKINAAVATLVECDELAFASGRMWSGGKPLDPSPALAAIFAALEPLRSGVALMRPGRPILSPPVEEQMHQRLEAYRMALANDPDTTLEKIPTPAWTPPKPPSVNLVEQDRVRGEHAWAAAIGNSGRVRSVG